LDGNNGRIVIEFTELPESGTIRQKRGIHS